MPRVLVVDDEAPNRVTLERILVREGWGVAHAEDGRAALEDFLVHHGLTPKRTRL